MRLLSRNAEALFWLARYLERAATLSRVIEMQAAFGGQEAGAGWAWLLALHNDEERFFKTYELTAENVIKFYVTDRENPGSIRFDLHWARENARVLRPFLPIEMWVQLNGLHSSVEAMTEADFEPAQLPARARGSGSGAWPRSASRRARSTATRAMSSTGSAC